MKINYTSEQHEAMKRLYGQFVKPGDLVFNIGANVGTRTQVFVDLGAEVVAVEPQHEMAEALRKRFGRERKVVARDAHWTHYRPTVQVVEAAAGPEMGEVELHLCTDNQLATCAPGWAESLKDRWPKEKWNRSVKVEQVTLDWLIEKFGEPSFAKVDCEGYEAEILKGLSQHIRTLCFECTFGYLEPVLECIDDLAERLGYSGFDFIIQEEMQLIRRRWETAEEIKAILKALPVSTFYADIFCI